MRACFKASGFIEGVTVHGAGCRAVLDKADTEEINESEVQELGTHI